MLILCCFYQPMLHSVQLASQREMKFRQHYWHIKGQACLRAQTKGIYKCILKLTYLLTKCLYYFTSKKKKRFIKGNLSGCKACNFLQQYHFKKSVVVITVITHIFKASILALVCTIIYSLNIGISVLIQLQHSNEKHI